ncbi:hypothetical protein [Ruminococcus callidus]|uniref:hypothetical protein n=1 Tax=Ruminococcus callidus TaxID=40519 RepID=UPI003520A7D3
MIHLRVVRCRIVQVQRELFSFFASFFFSAKKRRVAADLTPQFQERKGLCYGGSSRLYAPPGDFC